MRLREPPTAGHLLRQLRDSGYDEALKAVERLVAAGCERRALLVQCWQTAMCHVADFGARSLFSDLPPTYGLKPHVMRSLPSQIRTLAAQTDIVGTSIDMTSGFARVIRHELDKRLPLMIGADLRRYADMLEKAYRLVANGMSTEQFRAGASAEARLIEWINVQRGGGRRMAFAEIAEIISPLVEMDLAKNMHEKKIERLLARLEADKIRKRYSRRLKSKS